jgi:hypothetical protein
MPEPFAPSVNELAVPTGESPMPSSFIEMLDAEPNQSTSPEYIAAWWDESMDASSWWTNESITPLHAALILSGHNPNDGTDVAVLDAAEKTTSSGIGPREFRALKNAFDGASNDKPRTFSQWMEYAQQHGLKIHSWLGEWLLASGTTAELLTDAPDVAPPTSPDSAPATSTKHYIRNREAAVLTAEIAHAKANAPDPTSVTSIWGELTKLAECGFGMLIGFSSDGVQYRGTNYQAIQEPDVFTQRNLRDRMRRAKTRKEAPSRA